jgi:hypothetical protein
VNFGLSSVATAGPIFDNNNISFTGIPNTANYTVAAGAPTLTKLANGFSVAYNYTITVVNVAEIDTTWSASRAFSLAAAENLAVNITGNTSVTMPANSSLRDLLVSGAILPPNLSVDFTSQALKGPQNATPINWNKTSAVQNLAASNNYSLEMFSGPDWVPTAVGQKLEFSSLYTVTVIPEPASIVLMALGAGFVGLFAQHRRGAVKA